MAKLPTGALVEIEAIALL
ncbi:MAG: hypothetical protein WBZ27_01940 [Pseudolabrys sp.]